MAPYQREPQDSPHDPEVQSTVLMWARQLGKTEVDNNIVGYFIDADPSPIMMVQPTLELAEAWSEIRLAPMLRDCPCFRGKVRDPRSRDSGNRILSKSFLGGDISIVGANSSAGLRSRPRRVVLQDEVDAYPASVGEEGDPCTIAEKSTESFWNAVIIKTSTPTVKNFSRIEKEFNQSDQRYWFCPCPKCGTHQTLKWHQVLWGKRRIDSMVAHGFMSEKDAQAQFAVVQPSGEDAIYECESCHAHLNDTQRLKMIRAGEWRATAPFKGKRGYHLNGIYSPFKAKKGFKTRLHQMAAQFIEATDGGLESQKAWTNTFLAETWEERADRVDSNELMKRAEDYTPQTLPDGVILALAAVDVQKDRLQVEVMGLGLDDQTWGIETKTIQGDPEQDDVWQDLSDTLNAKYTRLDGTELSITATAIDMRHKPARVRSFYRTCGLPRVYLVYGVAGGHNLLVTARLNKHYRIRTYAVDGKMAKDTIFARLAIPQPKESGDMTPPRFMHFPAGSGYNEDWYHQLTSEVLKTKRSHGFAKQSYEKISQGTRNEALDIRVYLLACIDILKPNLTAIARRLKAPPAAPPKDYALNQAPPPPEVVAAKPIGHSVRRRIRVGKW